MKITIEGWEENSVVHGEELTDFIVLALNKDGDFLFSRDASRQFTGYCISELLALYLKGKKEPAEAGRVN